MHEEKIWDCHCTVCSVCRHRCCCGLLVGEQTAGKKLVGEKQVDIYMLKYEYSCKGKEGSVIMQADNGKEYWNEN